MSSKISIVGLDLGTTNTCCTAYSKNAYGNDCYDIVENEMNQSTTPSYVCYAEQILVGEAAIQMQSELPKNTLYNAKRLIGISLSDANKLLENPTFELTSEKVLDVDEPRYLVNIDNKKVKIAPEQVSAHILGSYKKRLKSKFLSEEVYAVITVPAHFNDEQRERTKTAAEIAGIKVLALATEPTAAAITYKKFSKLQEGLVLVYDFGGGTLDVSIIKVKNDDFTVLGIAGDNKLGGEDIDLMLYNTAFDKFCEANDCDPYEDDEDLSERSIFKLKRECEEAKKALSIGNIKKYDIIIPYFYKGLTLQCKITKSMITNCIDQLSDRLTKPIDKALKASNLTTDDITQIIMIGGSSRIPAVKELVQEHFDDRIEPLQYVNPDEAVSKGACYLAHQYYGERNNIKVENALHIQNVTPFRISIQDGVNDCLTLIEANVPLPTSGKGTFNTHEVDQEYLWVRIFEGDGAKTYHNKILGQFQIANLPKLGMKIPLTVEAVMDRDGILKVTANVYETSKKQIKRDLTINTVKHGLDGSRKAEAKLQHAQMEEKNDAKSDVMQAVNDAQVSLFKLKSAAENAKGSSNAKKAEELLEKWFDEVDSLGNANPKDRDEAKPVVTKILAVKKEADTLIKIF